MGSPWHQQKRTESEYGICNVHSRVRSASEWENHVCPSAGRSGGDGDRFGRNRSGTKPKMGATFEATRVNWAGVVANPGRTGWIQTRRDLVDSVQCENCTGLYFKI